MMILSVFNPPDVDPEQAHCTERNIRISTERGGQTLQSTVAKPVVEIYETVLKILFHKVAQNPPSTLEVKRSTATTTDATAIVPKYTLVTGEVKSLVERFAKVA
jgi:hypothetical protein